VLLQGKRILVTGVLTQHSLAFAVARQAQLHGAEIVLSSPGPALSITRLTAERLPVACDVLEMDVTVPEQLDRLGAELDRRWGGLDGAVHAIAFAPAGAMGGRFLSASWDEVATTLRVSAYSLVALANAVGPLLARSGRGALVGLTFDGTRAWPSYDWMGVAKSTLESCGRYLACALGPQGTRVNLVSCGPLRTVAASAIPHFELASQHWRDSAPLGWDAEDTGPAGETVCALLSDHTAGVTGDVVYVDGGAHAVGLSIPDIGVRS
jgi:meromycolic acid enoyl-[acyl-carrier-protein] reductase